MATGDLHNKFREDRSSGSRDMLADRQTYTNRRTDMQTDRQTDRNTPLPYRGGATMGILGLTFTWGCPESSVPDSHTVTGNYNDANVSLLVSHKPVPPERDGSACNRQTDNELRCYQLRGSPERCVSSPFDVIFVVF